MVQNIKALNTRSKKKRDPKVGTGKKPKGSGRRLYTDENPKDTVSIKFANRASVSSTKTNFGTKLSVISFIEVAA